MSVRERLDMITFERLLGIHGSRVERWPESQREALARLLESSEQARARWAEASALDRLLSALPEVEPAPALMARIASLPARHPRPARARWWPFHGALTPLLAWGAAAVLGVVVGLLQTPEPADIAFGDDGAELSAEGLEGDALELDEEGADDWSEVAELVTGAGWAAEEE